MTFPSAVKTGLIGQESTWGTKVSATKDMGIIKNINSNAAREITESMGIGAIDTQQITSGLVDTGVSVEVEYQHGRLLEYVLGTVGHADTGSDTTHTFTVSNDPPSASIEDSESLASDAGIVTTGCLVENAELKVALNETMSLKCDFKGRSYAVVTSATSHVLSTLPVFPHALCSISIGGVTSSEIQEFTFVFAKVVQRSGGIGSNLYYQGHATELRINFSGTLGFENNDLAGLYATGNIAGTSPSKTDDPAGIAVTLSADNGVALGSGKRSLDLALKDCILTTFDKVSSVGNLTFIDIAGVAVFNTLTTVDNINAAAW